MKPLELTVYPSQVDEHGRTRYYHPGSFPLPNLHTHPKQHIGAILTGSSNIGTMRKQKRLTTAELAAEYWRYESNIWEALAKMPEPPTPEAVMAGEEWNRRAEIVERFATLPHADEVPE